MPLSTEVGLGPGDTALDGDPAPHGSAQQRIPLQFSAHVYYDQTAGWIRITLGMQEGLSPGNVLHGDPASPLRKGAQHPLTFWLLACTCTYNCHRIATVILCNKLLVSILTCYKNIEGISYLEFIIVSQ